MSNRLVWHCKIQTGLHADRKESQLQLMRDRFGEPSEHHRHYTIYKGVEARGLPICVEDPDSSSDTHTITSLGGLAAPSDQLPGISRQHVVISSVRGDAHLFVRSLGYAPSHTWIEKGFLFNHDAMTIKIYDILRFDGIPLEAYSVAVTLECFFPN
jgi:hypothetical protein